VRAPTAITKSVVATDAIHFLPAPRELSPDPASLAARVLEGVLDPLGDRFGFLLAADARVLKPLAHRTQNVTSHGRPLSAAARLPDPHITSAGTFR